MFPRVMLSFGPALVLFLGSTPTVLSVSLFDDCSSDSSSCNDGKICYSYKGGKYCKGDSSKGATCFRDVDCMGQYGCINSFCDNLLTAGSACSETDECVEDHYCDTTCKKEKDNGESCTSGGWGSTKGECSSGYCNPSTSKCETDPAVAAIAGFGATLIAVFVIVPLLCVCCCIGIIYMAFCKKAKPVVVQQVVAPQPQAVPMMAAPVQAQPVVAQVV